MKKHLFLMAVLVSCSLHAHEELEQQIARVTTRIAGQPTNAMLYLRRGELLALHEEWARASADFDRAERLDPSLAVVDYARALLWLRSGDAMAAAQALDRFLAREPAHAEGHLARARALLRLGRPADAIADFDVAIAVNTPDVYHERAEVLASLGRMDDALRGLQQGIRVLGAISLQRQAIDLEVRAGRFDSALARVDALAAAARRKETYIALHGDILAKAGRHEEARKAWREALTLIDALPESQRNNATTRELRARLSGRE